MTLKKLKKIRLMLLCLAVGLLLAACGGGGGSTAQGTLSTSLMDASTNTYKAVYVTIAKVEVQPDSGGGWQTVASPNKTYNLLDLVNGVRETLGISSLAAGHYTQMRLILGATPDSGVNILSQPHPYADYTIDQNDAVQELTVPSGLTTGLKIVNGFDISANQTTELVLDFDAMHSVVVAGSSGKYQLKPTVKVLDTTEDAIASGVVSDASTGSATTSATPLAGALVTAQVADPASTDAKDQVAIEAGTLSASDGGYSLFLAPGDYNLVAVQDGYLPACSAVSLQAGDQNTANLALTPDSNTPGSLTGSISITGGSAGQVVTVDFRQNITCSGASAATTITVQSISVANGGSFNVTLPAGTYQVVASTANQTTQVLTDVTVTSAATTDLGNIAF